MDLKNLSVSELQALGFQKIVFLEKEQIRLRAEINIVVQQTTSEIDSIMKEITLRENPPTNEAQLENAPEISTEEINPENKGLIVSSEGIEAPTV